MQETQVQSLGREDPLEEDTATDSSIPAWRIPWTEEPGGLHGVTRVRQDWSNLARAHVLDSMLGITADKTGISLTITQPKLSWETLWSLAPPPTKATLGW